MRHMHYQAQLSVAMCGLLGVVVFLTGCAGMHESPDFIRHRYSQLTEPYERKDVVFFDAMFDVSYPDGDPGAEALRMQWLSEWLEARNMCPDGHEVVTRREFEMLEYNPGNYDVRYEVRCKVNAPE